jgi:hypothetical protein
MVKEIDKTAFNKLVKEVAKDLKSADGQATGKVVRSERDLSEASGVPMNQIGKGIYLAEITADPSLKIKADGKTIAKIKDGPKGDGVDGHRWPRIAVRAGISVGAAQKLYQDATGRTAQDAPYGGRGRRMNGNGAAPAPRTRGTKSAKAAPATSRGTSGRRASRSTAKTAPAPKRGGRTRGTRASSKAAANPK